MSRSRHALPYPPPPTPLLGAAATLLATPGALPRLAGPSWLGTMRGRQAYAR